MAKESAERDDEGNEVNAYKITNRVRDDVNVLKAELRRDLGIKDGEQFRQSEAVETLFLFKREHPIEWKFFVAKYAQMWESER